jgi:long-subunit fatty acid transport protein
MPETGGLEMILRKTAMPMKLLAASLFAVVLFGQIEASASGYEKSIMWGAREAGVAGIATPYIQGSDSIYFNPAGLATDKPGNSVALNVAGLTSQFKGPINNTNDESTSTKAFNTPGGLTYSHAFDQWGFGAGAFVSGGSKAQYDGVNFPGYAANPDVLTDLTIAEFSAGAAYKVNSDLKIGAAWRVTMAQGNLAFIQRASAAALANVRLSNLKSWDYTGFRLGAQYKLAEKTMLGLTYRSEVNIHAAGDVSGNVITNQFAGTKVIPIDSDTGTANTTFPMQIALGVQQTFSDDWSGLAEYDWSQYSRVGSVFFNTRIHAAAAGLDNNGASIQQNWFDQHNVRLAGDFHGFAWPIRFGYIWTSAVTDPDLARASFTPPGMAHTFTLGTGHAWTVAENPLQCDLAADYTMVQGDAGGSAAQSGQTGAGTDIRAGTYKAATYALHLGVAYNF